MNDPNGMVYYDGEYHLFYQYYPDSTVWGPMHWGHAISTDLVTWEHLPIALYPDELGLIFSGSAVIDWQNTSGLQQGEHPPMVAIFTQHLMAGEKAGKNDFQVQSIAYSHDKGRSWTLYEGNPVIPNPGIRDFRDPKVFWHEASSQWVMIFAAGDRVQLYGSPNLLDWEFLSDFGQNLGAHGGVWECPDLFELPIENGTGSQWVMLVSINPGGPNGGSGTQYFVGDFDGKTFTTSQVAKEVKWLDYGRDNYAGVTWSDIPQADGRRLFIGWMSNWNYAQVVPTSPWRSAMTLPRSLHLVAVNDDLRVFSRPIKELNKLAQTTTQASDIRLEPDAAFRLNVDEPNLYKAPLRFQIEIDESQTSSNHFGIAMENQAGDYYRVGLFNDQLYSDRTSAGLTGFEPSFAQKPHVAAALSGTAETLSLDIFLDKSSIEVFVNHGEQVLTDLIFPREDFDDIYLFTEDGELAISFFQMSHLTSIWK